MYKKILLPTDGSTYADEEVARATHLLADDGEAIVLSVAGELRASNFLSKKNIQNVNDGLIKEAEDAVEHMASKFESNVNVRKEVIIGFPSETIVDFAEKEGVDLIIISASGKSGIHKFFIGSVAEKVLKTTDVDVLLVHNK